MGPGGPVTPISFVWLALTRKCQAECGLCDGDSSPIGTHGSMTTGEWRRVICQAVALGARTVQFIGGEPTLHPGLPELINYALDLGVAVEVFTNLIYITDVLWAAFQQAGVSLTASCRPPHARAADNVDTAAALGIPLSTGDPDRPQVGPAHRGWGRGRGAPVQLCGGCGWDSLQVGPEGFVTPCAMSRWAPVGNVRDQALGEIVAHRMPAVRAALVRQGMPDWTHPAPRPRTTPRPPGQVPSAAPARAGTNPRSVSVSGRLAYPQW